MMRMRIGTALGMRRTSGRADLIVTGFAVSPASPTIALLGQLQLAAIQTLSDGTTRTVTTQAVWTSTNPLIATVTPLGLSAAVAVGDTTISASFAGRTAQAAVHVSLT